MKNLTRILGLTTAMFFAGCEYRPTETAKSYVEYAQAEKAPDQSLEEISGEMSLEGRIVKVQPSSVSFRTGETSADHEFIYVVVEDKDEKMHTLIYPYSKAILEREAKIKLAPLSSGMIHSAEFVKTFISKKYETDDPFFIEAEGFIVPQGIEYR